MRHETLRFGQSWARLAPWRGHPDIAQLVIGPDAHATPHSVYECLEHARIRGYRSIVTGALTADDGAPFVEAGLTVREHLHLLTRDLTVEPAAPICGTVRPTFLDRKAIVDLDDAAFEPFWRLGAAGIRDALDATPKRRMRVARGDQRVSAYAITGRAGEYGYLQRVAVHPAARRRGWGSALVADALLWLWEHGTARVYVNTQLQNRAALELYAASGFTLMPEGLLVLGGAL